MWIQTVKKVIISELINREPWTLKSSRALVKVLRQLLQLSFLLLYQKNGQFGETVSIIFFLQKEHICLFSASCFPTSNFWTLVLFPSITSTLDGHYLKYFSWNLGPIISMRQEFFFCVHEEMHETCLSI